MVKSYKFCYDTNDESCNIDEEPRTAKRLIRGEL